MADKQEKTLLQSIAEVQRAIVVPKNKHNAYGGFNYRSFEDIVAALKDPCEKAGIGFILEDDVIKLGDRYYIKATVNIFATDGRQGSYKTCAYAREALDKKGSDIPQVTGMASSYARKYALCGAFAIDGGGDPDAMAKPKTTHKQAPQEGPFTARCKSCGTRYSFESQEQYQQFVANPQCCPMPAWEIE